MKNHELAKRMGISPAAFSLIINHKPGVSDETRAKVLNELKKLGYAHLIKPEPVPVENKSKALCFVIFKRHGEILDLQPFFMLLMEHIEQRTRFYGYNMMMATIDLRHSLRGQIEYLNSLDVDGAIVFGTEMLEEDLKCFRDFSHPYIVVDNEFSTMPINTVAINNQMGTYQAIEYLAQMGHCHIGYIKGSTRINSFDEREKGYFDAAKYFNDISIEDNVISVRYSEEGSYQDFKLYLKENKNVLERVTAFVTDDDTISFGVIRALKEAGYHVPEDISIIGYNDRPICTMTKPPLTTISVSKFSFAVEAVDALMGIINNKVKNGEDLRTKKIRIDTRLLARESVKDLHS